MQMRKVPMRMCTGCCQMKPKRELVRVVKSQDGEISLDLTGKKAGREMCIRDRFYTTNRGTIHCHKYYR